MANFYGNLENFLVTPTENDHYGAGIIGDGRIMTELQHVPLLAALCPQRNVVLSGFALPTSGDADASTISAGMAVIAGYYISGAGGYPLSVTYTDSATNWVWLTLIRDGNGRVLRPELQVSTATAADRKPTDPTDSTLLGSVTVNGSGAITATGDFRNSGRFLSGYTTMDGGGALTSVDYLTSGYAITQGAAYICTVTFNPAFLRAPAGADGTRATSATSNTNTGPGYFSFRG